ncbi:MAG: hypothetical protein CMK44_07165 [Porticoccus sp.]|jgi:GlpG protein|nr:hypothetical protein [Porticoccus sp.]|tara:strand:+ start:231 stop:872 length:642 start_codon:yes stop_codon:yes gene_type:complete
MIDLDQLSLRNQLKYAPVACLFLVFSFIGAGIVKWIPSLIHHLTIQDYLYVGRSNPIDLISNSISNGEIWRLITPIFLHFGIFHLVFNALLFWVLGKKIEYIFGSLRFLIYATFIAIISNISQYWFGGSSLFGGLSGLVYGLLGFIWIFNKFSKKSIIFLPQGLLGFMLVWLFFGISGIVKFIVDINIANTAHIVGLISGMILGYLKSFRTYK